MYMSTQAGVKLLEETFPEYAFVDYGFGHFWGYREFENAPGFFKDPEKII